MEAWQKTVIDDNVEELENSLLLVPKFMTKLQSCQALTYEDIEDFERQKKNEGYGDAMARKRFLEIVKKKDCFDNLIKALDGACQDGASRILKDGRRKEEERKLESPAVIKDVLNFFRKTEKLKVVVKRPDSGFIDRKDDDYKLKKDGIRRALIINIIEFDLQEKREGADADTKYMTDLLKQMDFEILPEEPENKTRYTKEELLKEINDFREDCDEDNVDACMVFVASHGYHNKIVTSDEEHVDIYDDIVYKFSHDRETGCPEMKNRPKIFIFPTCQDFYKPAAVQTSCESEVSDKADGESAGNGRPPSPDEQPRMSVKRPRSPSPDSSVPSKKTATDGWDDSSRDIKDAIVILPQVPGCSANRDKFRGTWFVFIFVYVLMNLACDTPLAKMLEKVQELVYKIKGVRRGDKQLATFTNFGFKTMYLFPNKKAE